MERGGEKRKTVEASTSSNKRAKGEDEPKGSRFEEELASIASKGARQSQSKWQRPLLPPLDPAKDSITFQQLDLDHYIGKNYQHIR